LTPASTKEEKLFIYFASLLPDSLSCTFQFIRYKTCAFKLYNSLQAGSFLQQQSERFSFLPALILLLLFLLVIGCGRLNPASPIRGGAPLRKGSLAFASAHSVRHGRLGGFITGKWFS
jgi:hypothetical protein